MNRSRTLSKKESTRTGKVIVLTAPSGSGKTTIAKRLLNDYDLIRFSVSATTRQARPDEKDGADYHFLSKKRFNQLVKEGGFVEWEEFYGGTRYGTLREEVDKQRESGYFVLLDVEVKGARNVKRLYGDECLTIFIRPPSLETLRERLSNRGTESEKALEMRLDRARMELEMADHFDHVVVNDDLDKAYRRVRKLVESFMKPNQT